MAPGFVAHERVAFVSAVSLKGATIFVVPALQPYVTITSALPSVLPAGATQALDIEINIPDSVPIGSTFQGTVQIRVGSQTIATPLKILFEVQKSAFKSPDPSRLVQDVNGMIFPVNQLLIVLPIQATKSVADQIASNIGAEVVGFASLSNTYQLELATNDGAQLESILATLVADPRLDGVSKNFAFNLFSIATDLSNLVSCHPNRASAYTQVQLINAWDLIANRRIPPNFVNIGIIDSGIDRSHPEFAKVSIRPFDSLLSNADTRGHGTSVAGIIGAGNDLTFSSCMMPNDLQMNGFVSGVPSASYFLDVLGSQRLLFAAEFSPFVSFLALDLANVINVSEGIEFTSSDLTLSVTVYQRGARRYGQPVLYTGP